MGKDGTTVFSEYVELVDQQAEAAAATNDVERLYYTQADRSMSKWHHYLAVYDRHLSRYRGRPVRLLEIGIKDGGSLQMWRRYFGADAVIHGLDVNPDCAAIDDPDLTIHIGSQDDPALLDRIVTAMGGVDVVIDDGSHVWSHQIATFELLYDRVAQDGVYICEDTHTSYWPEYQGAPATPTFHDFAREKVDAMHAWYSQADETPDTAFARQTESIAFYDSQVVFERRKRPPPRTNFVGERSVT